MTSSSPSDYSSRITRYVKNILSIQSFQRSTPPAQPTTDHSTIPGASSATVGVDDASAVESIFSDETFYSAADVITLSSGSSDRFAVDVAPAGQSTDILPVDGVDAGSDVVVEGEHEAAGTIMEGLSEDLSEEVTEYKVWFWDAQLRAINPNWCKDSITLMIGPHHAPFRGDPIIGGRPPRVPDYGTRITRVFSAAQATSDLTTEVLTPVLAKLSYIWGIHDVRSSRTWYERVTDNYLNLLRLDPDNHMRYGEPHYGILFVPTMEVVEAIYASFTNEMNSSTPKFTAFDSKDGEFQPMLRTFVVVPLNMLYVEEPWLFHRRTDETHVVEGKTRPIVKIFYAPDYNGLTIESHIHPFPAILQTWYKLRRFANLEETVSPKHLPLIKACLKVFDLWMKVKMPQPRRALSSTQPKMSYSTKTLAAKRPASAMSNSESTQPSSARSTRARR